MDPRTAKFTRVRNSVYDRIIEEAFRKYAPVTTALIDAGLVYRVPDDTAHTIVSFEIAGDLDDLARQQTIPLPYTHATPEYVSGFSVQIAAENVAKLVEKRVKEVFANSRVIVALDPQVVEWPSPTDPDRVRVITSMTANCRASGKEYESW